MPKYFLIFLIFLMACVIKKEIPNMGNGTHTSMLSMHLVTIIIPNNSSKIIESAAKDAALMLEKVTHTKIKIQKEQANNIYKQGILLSTVGETALRKRLEQQSTEGFFLTAQKGNLFKIQAVSDEGLANGLYFLLEEFGFRWYLPNENWTITPDKLQFSLKNDTLVIPDFKVREFFPSGGAPPHWVMDSTNIRQKEWELWKIRNRFGGERKIWGHQGYEFNKSKKSVLVEHPEYLAEIKGQRIAWSDKAKWCISNPDLVNLFVQERVEIFQKNFKRYGHSNLLGRGIGVEPTDGGGHCTCEACQKMGSVSTRTFYLANKVAEELTKNYPKATVSILAYNFHADTPAIDIHPSVDVAIVPRGFHKVAPGREYIQLWHDKLKRPMAIYDYWSIPLWSLDLPTFDTYNIGERIRFWKNNGIDAFLLESTYSKGAIAIPLYVASKLSWDSRQSEVKILEEFLSNCFGEAKKPMERLLKRWNDGFKELKEIPFALQDIKEAEVLAKTSVEKERVQEWKQYIHYLRLICEFKALPKNSQERKDKEDDIIEYIWQIYPSYMVHTNAIQDQLTHQYEKSPDLQRKWTNRKGYIKKELWANIPKVNIDSLIQNDINEYPIKAGKN